ncbi:MAG TPA: fumarylacetoacetate hydrolase family protein [Actinomycetota bacterium]|jgi:2-keto-4-pentenoate hydratase/2-oxohepta-3-ene-1,7-dioic acid hydratase in catechol pathway|nr:fumarylacetoacetate hydrolase family protein [Actinomycetota bacterium]
MKLATLTSGAPVRLDDDGAELLPGRLVDHLCREPHPPSGRRIPLDEVRLGPPIARPGKIVCVGLNYRDHAAETGAPLPEKPLLFNKLPTCVIGPGEQIPMPDYEGARLDHEAELAVIIGRPAHGVEEDEALEHVGGFACFNDVSERTAQKGDGQWLRGKSLPGFAPFGPHVVTPDEVGDPQSLAIRCLVNGQPRQESSTSEMVFSVAFLVSYISRFFPLEPGDVIATGTPSGVGLGSGVYLRRGDEVAVEIEKVGRLTNVVV